MNTYYPVRFDLIESGEFFIDAISTAHRHVTPPNTYIRYATEHKHDRLFFIVEGKVRFDMFNAKPICAEKGSVVYVPYNIAYKTEWLGETTGEIYSLNYVMTDRENYQITIAPEIVSFAGYDTYFMKNLFRECCETFSKEQCGYQLKCKYIFFKILYALISMRNESEKNKITKVKKYIENNYLEEIPVKELAKMCNLGECMFRRCFKQQTGTSPVKYRNKLRIQKAYELLTVESHSVSEAMELTGFYDASYFNKTFKAYTGKSPSECKNVKKSDSTH